ARIAVMPLDVELFSISAGGVLEPRADWTEQALTHFRAALHSKKPRPDIEVIDLEDADDETVQSLNSLHGAVGAAIAGHHFGMYALPTKEGRLDWSMGPEVRSIRERTGADYALFTFIRDSYASSERVAAMVVAAAFGVGLSGGRQVGYASLVELETGRVVWFNFLLRGTGDLREPDKARETLEALLSGFPQ
ncbi:MAG TPA: hypothetical protein VF104_12540, partial [Burkholderiales bacterium]